MREVGYYWVRLKSRDWRGNQELGDWEPAGWFGDECQSWYFVGDDMSHPEDAVAEVGEEILV